MVLPEVGAEAEIRFKNRVTCGTTLKKITVTSTQLECIGDRILVAMKGFLERCSDKQDADEVDQTPNPCIAERVIFNPPATIAIWKDGSKTVVKCDEKDEYDPMYGLALCYMKKALGNTSRGLNDALRVGYDGIEKIYKKHKPLNEVRNFLETQTVRNDFKESQCCPVGPNIINACESCPYTDLPYGICADLLREDIIKIRKQDADGGKKE